MTWRVVAASAAGISHIDNGRACEDSCFAQVESDSATQPLLTIFVADGAGSAAKGCMGASLAIEAATEFVGQQDSQSGFTLNDHWATECIQAVRERIYAGAERQGAKPRDFACTFLGVIATPYATLLMQIGDGGIVIDIGSGLELPIIPMTGEYANMTNFITDDNAIDVLAVRVFSNRADKIAVFSDGIQRLALTMATNTVYAPFFTPFFTVLSAATATQENLLQAELEQFLQSPAVNERTDDDKSLALAYWVG